MRRTAFSGGLPLVYRRGLCAERRLDAVNRILAWSAHWFTIGKPPQNGVLRDLRTGKPPSYDVQNDVLVGLATPVHCDRTLFRGKLNIVILT